jgi:hypothetical protein
MKSDIRVLIPGAVGLSAATKLSLTERERQP